MAAPIDILENDIDKLSHDLLKKLLKDHSVSHHYQNKNNDKCIERNIIWATSDYARFGDGYGIHDQITPEKITGGHGEIIRPRARKSIEEQRHRITDKAEVFTPAWICNKQNNLIDNAWFGREGVFNSEIDDDDNHTWKSSEEPIQFPNSKGKTWQDYVLAPRLEMACGEAPYLVSRYDATSCDCLIPIPQRIGLFDRKLRVVGENTSTTDEWLIWAFNALHNTYGFEWQGDNLLLAREAMLYTFKEHYEYKFHDKLPIKTLENVAYIISWNLWQMDGLKFVVPDSCEWAAQTECAGLFGEEATRAHCPACKGKGGEHIGIKCQVVEWKKVTMSDPARTGTKKAIYLYPNLMIPNRLI